MRTGYVVPLGVQTGSEPTFAVEIRRWDVTSMSSGNRKRLRQASERNLESRALNLTHLQSVYGVLCANREALGVEMPVSQDRLRIQLGRLGRRYSLHGTFDGSQMIAGAVVVETFPGFAYVFMWGERPEFRQWSPVVSLFNHLVSWANEKGFEYLDLGTASLFGLPNPGLVRFKKNLGAHELALLNFELLRPR